jgi:hypothetical protein
MKSTDNQESSGPAQIPQFDLARQIMAEQRRVTAARRKRPGPAAIPGPEPVTGPSPGSVLAQIVARDIERLCGERQSRMDGTLP